MTPEPEARRGERAAMALLPSASYFNRTVAPAVAEGVARAAHETGAARRRRRLDLKQLP